MHLCENPSPLLAAFPIVIALPVQWGDQDAFGHVNNTMYFRWFESSRIAYMEQFRLLERLRTTRVGPILAAIGCDYRAPLFFPDVVEVGSRVTRIGRTSLSMEHAIVSRSKGVLAAESRSTLVLYDYATEKPHPIPDEIRKAVEELEGRSLEGARTGEG